MILSDYIVSGSPVKIFLPIDNAFKFYFMKKFIAYRIKDKREFMSRISPFKYFLPGILKNLVVNKKSILPVICQHPSMQDRFRFIEQFVPQGSEKASLGSETCLVISRLHLFSQFRI